MSHRLGRRLAAYPHVAKLHGEELTPVTLAERNAKVLLEVMKP